MGIDVTWLADEARAIHSTFSSLFYVLIGTLLVVGVILEYFKFPLGEMPAFGRLIGRVLIAALLLQSYPWISNMLADVTELLAKELGDMNKFDVIRARLADKFSEMTFSWFAVKDTIIIIISYITFVLFHFSYYAAEGFLLYTWTLLYVFSPLLIAFFVLPATAGATKALYRSLFEVSLWKVVWAVLATLLWSVALGDINKPGSDVSFLSVITYNLILAGSLLLTPLVVHALTGAGLASLSRNIGVIGLGASAIAPAKAIRVVVSGAKHSYNAGHSGALRLTEKHFPKVNQVVNKIPRFHIPKRTPIFEKPIDGKDKRKGK